MERHMDEDRYVDEVYGDDEEIIVEEPGVPDEDCKYPDIVVQLTGEDGNAFAILGRVSQALRRGGVPKEERDKFFAEAQSGDYDNLLVTCMRWVNVQ